jgi:MerR-like DNA binding protein
MRRQAPASTVSFRDVLEATGVSRNQLVDFLRGGIVDAPALGTGHRRRYTAADVARVDLAARIRRFGIPTAAVAALIPVYERVRRRYPFEPLACTKTPRGRWRVAIAQLTRDGFGPAGAPTPAILVIGRVLPGRPAPPILEDDEAPQ